MLWLSFRGYKERFMHGVICEYARGEYITFTGLYRGRALPRSELRDPTIDAVCSDSWCRENVAWL